MPIKRRLTDDQRLRRQLPKGWKAAIRHPLLSQLCYGATSFDPTPANIVKAIITTKSWKGASWREKVFVLCLDIVLERAFGVTVLEPDNYNRLQEHLTNNNEKLYVGDWQAWHVFIWDVYHDGMGLLNMEPGDLALAPVKPPKRKPVVKKKRKKLPKHS